MVPVFSLPLARGAFSRKFLPILTYLRISVPHACGGGRRGSKNHLKDHKNFSKLILHQSDRDCSVSDPVLRNTTDPNDFMPNCTTAQMIEALDGHLSLIHSTFANDEDVMETGDSVQEWKDSLRAQV